MLKMLITEPRAQATVATKTRVMLTRFYARVAFFVFAKIRLVFLKSGQYIKFTAVEI